MQTKHSFLKGLNRDISKDKFPTDAYYYLLNGRILTDDNATMSDIINLKSNTDANIDDDGIDRSGYTIIGYTTIQNDIILFYAANAATGVDSAFTQSTIDVLEYQGNNAYLRVEKWIGNGLNFRVDKKIRAIARYEASDIKKIYWTDNNEPIRHANIGEDISALEPTEFDFNGDFYNTNRIHLDSYTSGSIKQGVIYYAYRFVKTNGYKTVFPQVSESIPIARNIYYDNPIGKTQGDDVYDVDNAFNTGIGTRLSLTINVADYYDYYDYMEVISLWHSALHSVPDVTIISRVPILDGVSDYAFIDDGTNNYGTLKYSQLLEQQNSFVAKDLVAKDNRLFTANITEKFFDLDSELGSYWDARAYRFSDVAGGQVSVLRDSGYATSHNTLTGPSPSYVSVGETEDCLNIFNRITDDEDEELEGGFGGEKQKYQADGVTLGGSGLNIDFDFYTGSYYISSLSETNPSIGGSIENDYQLGLIRGFQRDEVYRFGIVFFDRKGRQSFVKWIADIRIPDIIDAGSVTTFDSGDSRITAKPVFVNVYLNNPPVISGEELDWQVVYVKREEKDKTVVFAGLMNPGRRNGVDTRPSMVTETINTYRLDSDVILNKYNAAIMSPDINFRKTEYLNIDYLHVIGELTSEWAIYKDILTSHTTWTPTALPVFSDSNIFVNIERFPTLDAITGGFDSRILTNNGEAKAPPPTALEFTVPVGVDPYKHVATLDSGPRSAPHGTAMVYRLGGLLPSPVSDGNYYGYGRKTIYDSQYGGQAYENRATNTYIPASRKDTTASSSVTCSYGDSFIRLFEYLRLIRLPALWGKEQSLWEQFVCETSVNVLFRHDDPYSKNYYLDDEIPTNINEDPYVDPVLGLSFSELYKYNFVYSSISEDRKFFAKPLDFVNYEEQITKVKYSDVKLNIEDHDSWLSFRTNNFNEASQNYGEINRLEEFYDKIYSFQDNAFALVSINPRVTQQSQDGVTITLGTGDVIDDFNYLTTEIGCQDNSDVIKSFSAMYWLDKNKKKIYSYNGKIQSVTDLKGMHSYLKNNVYEDSYFIGAYDIHNSEVIMTFYDNVAPNSEFLMQGTGVYQSLQGDTTLLDTELIIDNVYKFKDGWYRVIGITDTYINTEFSHGTPMSHNTTVDMHTYITERDNFTLAYNEKVQAFTSFYSFLPDLYVSHNRDFFTSQNSRDLWQHNIGNNFNEFYDTAYPLQLKLISNYGSQAQGEYTNFKYFMSVEDNLGNYQRNETFTNIHAKNEYQASTDIILYPMHLPNDADRTKYVLDTSSTRIGVDWYTALSTPDEGLTVYNNQLYRNTSGAASINIPTHADYDIAELANIRKTVEHWLGQMPRYEHRDPVYDSTYLTSDRLRSNWLETTFEFRSVLPTVNIEERKLKISDITLTNEAMLF